MNGTRALSRRPWRVTSSQVLARSVEHELEPVGSLPGSSISGSAIIRAIGEKLRDTCKPLFNPLYVAYLLIEDRKSARFFPQWVRSMGPSVNSFRRGIPWLPFALIEWLDKHLTAEMDVLEFGSGGSTIFMASRVGQLHSVEHHAPWYADVSVELQRRGLTNVRYVLRPPEDLGYRPTDFEDNYRHDFPTHSFERYVRELDQHPDRSLDLILIDGRARRSCVEHAIGKIKPGGHLVFDNSTMREYRNFYGPLARFPRQDLVSVAPFWPPAKW